MNILRGDEVECEALKKQKWTKQIVNFTLQISVSKVHT